jgi:F-type H+-transporting ATPase subunit alpha
MKRVAGTLKIDQAQYRELEAFTKFGGDLDPVTAYVIDKGKKNTKLLIQPQYSPMPVEEQIAVLYCGVNGLLKGVGESRVAEFERIFLERLRGSHREDVLDVLASGVINDEIATKLTDVAAEVVESLGEK